MTGPRDSDPTTTERPTDEALPETGDRRAADRRTPADVRARRAIRDELASGAAAEERPRAEDPGPAPGAVIELERVHLAFDDRVILEDVSFLAKKGETIVVVGESGTGKSTTLKLILRLLVPDSGRVYVGGEDITQLSFGDALRVRQKMGMVFQGAALFDSMSIFENVAYPLREHTDYDEDEIERRVRQKLQFVDLNPDEIMELLPSSLSGGMRKRVGIARAIANDPELMLYDEPTSGLDPLTTATITRLIIKLQRELGVTSIVVSHDIRSAFRMATFVALLAERHIRFFGSPEEMAASDDKYIQDFLGGF
ncbi:ABC transporter related protein [Gemmatirosa kalamazoonensis]|uniref:ABC transporter related protein n=1 Tax=Gemmatirosa kalamazoonensis TaxID=861299 RepID=W0RNI3_9BACT|nr:ABC transporter ATP-binding protein [Gemmatirosa kalamazoonensis]AHG91013.1 ABC transporter related protein [Gemmatirosa kalamazoonensis]